MRPESDLASLHSRSAKVECSPPPSTFTPFSPPSCDTTSYCASTVKDTKTLVWSGNDGEVTREEVESAMAVVASLGAVTISQGNNLAYGDTARAARAAALLYQVTGDVRALNVLVRFADNALSFQNDVTTGIKTWDGLAEPVWLGSDVGYPNSEQGAIVVHLAEAALEILRTPCLYNIVPPSWGASWPLPSSFTKNTTYLQRATAYLAAGDLTYNSYLLRNFFSKSGLLIQPNSPLWNPGNTQPSAGAAGQAMPWNRQMMVLQGLIRLADAHELLPSPNTSWISTADNLIKTNIQNFISHLTAAKSKGGSKTWWWSYSTLTHGPEEASTLHGWYDYLGLFQAWQRNSKLYGITNDTMISFANTFEDTISLPGNLISGLIDGTSNANATSRNAPGSMYGLYSYWRQDVYPTTVNDAISGSTQRADAVYMLWVKHALHLNNDTFWRARMTVNSSGVPVVVTPSASGTSSDLPPSQSSGNSKAKIGGIAGGVVGGLLLLGLLLLLWCRSQRRKRKASGTRTPDSEGADDKEVGGIELPALTMKPLRF